MLEKVPLELKNLTKPLYIEQSNQYIYKWPDGSYKSNIYESLRQALFTDRHDNWCIKYMC